MASHRFSTNDLPVAVRREVAEAAYAVHVRGKIDYVPDVPFSAELSIGIASDVQVAMMDVSPVKFFTPPDDRGMLYLGMTLTGGGYLLEGTGDGRAVKDGDICVMRSEHDYSALADRPSRILNLAIPYARILPQLSDVRLANPVLTMERPAARLLHGYAATLLEHDGPFTAAEQEVFAGHITDLVALLVGPTRDAAEQARHGGARVARRQTVQRDVRANLDNPLLSLDWIARRHGISPSYVRTLFYDEGTSFTDFVTAARLDRVADLLRSPAEAGRTVAALALAAGFGDVSWFNQLFRRRFGMTPSDMRAGGIWTVATPPATVPKP